MPATTQRHPAFVATGLAFNVTQRDITKDEVRTVVSGHYGGVIVSFRHPLAPIDGLLLDERT